MSALPEDDNYIYVTENEKIARLAFFRYIIMKTRKKKHHKYIIYNLHSNAFFRYNHNYENMEKKHYK